MEQERLPCTGPGPGQCGSDREVFERVWRRVMPEDRPDCPFTLYSDETAPGTEILTPPARGGAPVPARTAAPEETAACGPGPEEWAASVPALPQRQTLPACGSSEAFPPENDVPCLGSASSVHGEELQRFILDETADFQLYRGLARRISGSPSRTLAAIAADEQRHARRLSAAYFLISGVRFQPERPAAAPTGTFLGTLRARFAAEQRGEAAYRAAAERTADPCLRELYLELAGDEASHTWLLRGILEQI